MGLTQSLFQIPRAISRGFFSNSIQTLSLTPIRWSFVVAASPRCVLCGYKSSVFAPVDQPCG
jgi:hypothetical protein